MGLQFVMAEIKANEKRCIPHCDDPFVHSDLEVVMMDSDKSPTP